MISTHLHSATGNCPNCLLQVDFRPNRTARLADREAAKGRESSARAPLPSAVRRRRMNASISLYGKVV